MELESGEIIAIAIVGLLLWSLLLYAIIRAAITSSQKKQDRVNEIILRIMVKNLEKSGMTRKEITELYQYSNEEFWNSLK